MTHPRVVNKIVDTYLKTYKEQGFQAAQQYAERMLADNKPLKKAVRVAVEKRLEAQRNGGEK